MFSLLLLFSQCLFGISYQIMINKKTWGDWSHIAMQQSKPNTNSNTISLISGISGRLYKFKLGPILLYPRWACWKANITSSSLSSFPILQCFKLVLLCILAVCINNECSEASVSLFVVSVFLNPGQQSCKSLPLKASVVLCNTDCLTSFSTQR